MYLEAWREYGALDDLRGRVVPVMDVRAHVAGHELDVRGYQHLVVVEAGDRQVGLAVEDVQDVVEVPLESVEKPADLAGGQGPGVVRIDDALVLVVTPEDLIHV